MSDDCAERLDELEERVEANAEAIEGVRNTANKALSRAIDVQTEVEELADPDDRLQQRVTELEATVRELYTEVASDIERWAGSLVANMVNEVESNGRQRVVVKVSDAHKRLDFEPDRTTIYDVFEAADAACQSDAINHAKDPHRLQLDTTAGEIPRYIGPVAVTDGRDGCGESPQLTPVSGGDVEPPQHEDAVSEEKNGRKPPDVSVTQ